VNFGDLVSYDLRASHGGKVEKAYVIGTMKYSDDVVMLADEKGIGMPINVCHCRVVSSGHEELARRFRARYETELSKYPPCMKPIRHNTTSRPGAPQQED